MSTCNITEIVAAGGRLEVLATDGAGASVKFDTLSPSSARKLARLLFKEADKAEEHQLDALRRKLERSKSEQEVIESEIRSLEACQSARQQVQSVVDEKRLVPRVPGDPRT